jgi:AcrR family transcriptional regulator
MSSGDPETRIRIMKATRELIEQSEGELVRLQDIAQAAGVSRQAIYLHFGSRVGLLVATVQYVDQSAGFFERTAPIRRAENGLQALELFVVFWADYISRIHRLAKALLAARDTDPAAAAAWSDRMDGLRNVCRHLVERLETEGHLLPVWSIDTAADTLWALISIQLWEQLVVDRGWSKSQYTEHLTFILRQALTPNP